MPDGPPDEEPLGAGGDQQVLANRYRLADTIGRGGMADVWSAEDTASGQMVAVKVMRIGEAADVDRFAAEMQILSRLDHPAIVPLFDTGRTPDDSPYFVMQLIEGESLSARIREEGPMSEPDLVRVARRIAGALAHAHERGVIHRDIKPANILIDQRGRGFLTDFGVARLVDATMITRTGTTIGTAAYLAPEQLQDSAVGPAADVYAFGLVLIEAFTGRRAFRGSGVEAAMARLGRDPAIPDDLPDNWRGLLLTMTRRDPERRPSAAVVEAVLRGRQPPPPLDPDELAARAVPVVPSDDLPTAISRTGDTGSGQWDPPSGGSGSHGSAGPPTPTPPPPPPATPPPPPLEPPASRSRPLLIGTVVGAVVALVISAVLLVADPFDDDPVDGSTPVHEATRTLLEVLDASETLRAGDPALSRRLRGLSEDVVDAVNDDRLAAASRGIARMGEALGEGIETRDIDAVAVGGMVDALQSLNDEIRAESVRRRAEDGGQGG